MPDRRGPFRSFRFIIEIDEVAKAGFNVCHAPASSTSVVEYREGNDPPTSRKLGGLNEYGLLVLKSGVTADSLMLYEWRELVEEGKLDAARRNIAVVLLDREGNPATRWEFTQAWPSRYEAPTLDAERSAVAIETLEIVFEEYRRGGDGSGDDEETDGGRPRISRRPDRRTEK